MYFATTHFGSDGGICITASHNPMDYDGMKMVRAGSAPLDAASGLARIKELAEENAFESNTSIGKIREVAEEARAAYVERICQFVDISALKQLKLLVNAGHETAGPTFDTIVERLSELGAPLDFKRIFHEPDGSFPQGIPHKRPRGNYHPRSPDHLEHSGSCGESRRAGQARTGHAFLKQAIRDENAVYGGEVAAHHYFRNFVYCDSGMIPWLLVAELVSRHGPLVDLVGHRKAAFPSSGEINFTLEFPKAAIARVRAAFEPEAISIDEMDGLGFDMGDWRFNLRSSNTEPVVRLNVEARGDAELVARGVKRVKRALFG